MILPLYAGLDRLSQSMLEASRDPGADRISSFWRVTLPLCRPTMVGNLINDSVQSPGQTGQAGAFVMLVFLAALLPMLYYIRVASRRDEVSV
jgi:spermidine/putrescine transport system permease protein